MSSSQRNWRCSATDKAANYLGLMRKAGRIALGEHDAIAAVTDPGLAKAFVSALAQADPEQYSNTAAELAAQTRTDTGTAPTGGGRNGKRRKRV